MNRKIGGLLLNPHEDAREANMLVKMLAGYKAAEEYTLAMWHAHVVHTVGGYFRPR